MEFHLSFLQTVATTTSIIAIVYVFLILNPKRAKTGKSNNPPEAKGAWPIIGHLHLLGGSELPHRVLANMAEKYGPIFTIKLGVHQALVVNDWKIAKECFTKNDKVFASRPKSLVVELMGYNYAMFGLGPYGDYWRQVRKIVMVELLSQKRVEMLSYVRGSEVRASTKDIYEVWERNKNSEYSDMAQVEMKQLFGNLSLNIVTRIISGKRFSPEHEEAVLFQAVVKKFLDLLGVFMVSDFIPCLKFLDLGGYQKSMKMSAKEMDNILQGWLEELKRQRESGPQHEGNQVFMDSLISILEGASEEEFTGFDHDTIIKASSLTILSGALDTITVTLTWALSLLLNNPEALKTAQDELDIHVGRDRLIEESDINNLIYLQAIIKETLRLYPAGPLSAPRESIEDCIVGGYSIPKGTRMITNIWKLQRDPKIWPDPNQFQPERFLTSKKDIDVKGQHYELLPFGSGRRMCPGVSFALQSLHFTLASLIQGFEIVKPSKDPIDMSDSFGLTNMKATPLEVLLRPRLSINMYHVGV